MTDLPYTYTDDDGVALRVGPRVCTAYDRPGRTSVGFYTPTGDEAVGLARAVLAAAGDTGHMVISRDELTAMRRADARSMRERAAALTEEDDTARAAAIRALPLLPDGDDTEDTGPPPCAAMSPVPGAPGLPYGCEGTAGHEGDHYALRGSVKWGDTEPAVVHVATPEGITPCGCGTRDVTTSPLIPEVTCVGCLQAIALEKGGKVIAMRDERDRLRTAWESARRGRAQAREQLDDARRYVRILDAQRKDLPEDDIVEPGDEVPALEHRVGALEQQYTDLANLVHGHGEDLTRLRYRFTEEDDG